MPLDNAITTSIPLINATIKNIMPIQKITFSGIEEKLVIPSVASFSIFLLVYLDLPALLSLILSSTIADLKPSEGIIPRNYKLLSLNLERVFKTFLLTNLKSA